MYSGVEFTDAFGSDFTASVARERPAHSSNEYTFAPEGSRAQDGLLVRVHPNGGKAWRGMFACAAAMFSGQISGLYGAPDPSRLLAISFGAAYLVDIRAPHSYAVLDPIVAHVVAVPEAGSLVVADNDTLFGIGKAGVAWKQAFNVDGFEQLSSAGRFVEVTAMILGSSDYEIVRLDARTGKLMESDNA